MNRPLTPPILTEDIAQALRRGDYAEAARLSPLMGCLLTLLETIGSRDWQAPLIEGLPHHADSLDIVDLRNLLVHLGYTSHERRVDPTHLPDARLLPALLFGPGGEALLLRSRSGKQFQWYDGQSRSWGSGPLPFKGRLFVLEQLRSDDTARPSPRGVQWFSTLVRRFASLFLHLIAMTFWLNLTTVAVPLFIMAVYDQVIGIHALTSLPWLVAGIAFALVVELGLRLQRAHALGVLSGRIDYLISTSTFGQLLALPPSFTERSAVSVQLSKLRQFDSLRDFFAGGALVSLIELPALPVFIGVLAWLGGWLALIPAVAALSYALATWLLMGRIRRGLNRTAVARTRLEQMLMETFSGLREIKALNVEADWLQRYAVATAEQAESNRASTLDQAMLACITQAVTSLSATAMLGFGTLSVIAGDVTVGALIACMTLMWRVQSPLQGLFVAYFRFDAVSRAIRDLDHLMSLQIERRGRKSMLMAQRIEGSVNFDRVSFRYGPDSDPALLGVSLQIPPRAFVAIVGPNGSGKSTLLKLVNAMYPIASGTVMIDGIDTRQFDVGDLRRLISYVPQQPALFRGTIAQNLRLRHPLASDDEMRIACFRTGILRAIEALPDGFNTMVGDNCTARVPGSLVRGICIARALVARSPILLLDEPASSLDSDGDDALMMQLQSLKGEVTIMMVTHRPSHVRLADRVVVMAGGVVKGISRPKDYFDSLAAAHG